VIVVLGFSTALNLILINVVNAALLLLRGFPAALKEVRDPLHLGLRGSNPTEEPSAKTAGRRQDCTRVNTVHQYRFGRKELAVIRYCGAWF